MEAKQQSIWERWGIRYTLMLLCLLFFASYVALWIYLERFKNGYRGDDKFGVPAHASGAMAVPGIALDVILVAMLFAGSSWPVLLLTFVLRTLLSIWALMKSFY